MSDLSFNKDLSDKPIVAVIGLGFVGGAMAAALSCAKDALNAPLYRVLGIDLPNKEGMAKIDLVNNGIPPILSNDPAMDLAYTQAKKQRNLFASSEINLVENADIVVVDIPFDVEKKDNLYTPRQDLFLDGIRKIAKYIRHDALVIVETTVPPGTTENFIWPVFEKELKDRNLTVNNFCLSHSYERVTPGKNYLNSITNFYRVYSGMGKLAAQRTKTFLESFINTKDYPLTELETPTASEMAKVMENSFRAVNIAFLQEWSELAEASGVNMYKVLNAIRMRPTHKNIMSPGFGVGGYCLTKDALLADWVSKERLNRGLFLSCKSLEINDRMPDHSVNRLEQYFGSLNDITIMLMGVSYINDVSDTRYSPSALFHETCVKRGAKVIFHDPMVSYWPDKNLKIEHDINKIDGKNTCDAVVLAVRHTQYLNMLADEWIKHFPSAKLFLDANNILTEETAYTLKKLGRDVLGIGKGHWYVSSKEEE